MDTRFRLFKSTRNGLTELGEFDSREKLEKEFDHQQAVYGAHENKDSYSQYEMYANYPNKKYQIVERCAVGGKDKNEDVELVYREQTVKSAALLNRIR